jgi:hypothetical protein
MPSLQFVLATNVRAVLLPGNQFGWYPMGQLSCLLLMSVANMAAIAICSSMILVIHTQHNHGTNQND